MTHLLDTLIRLIEISIWTIMVLFCLSMVFVF